MIVPADRYPPVNTEREQDDLMLRILSRMSFTSTWKKARGWSSSQARWAG